MAVESVVKIVVKMIICEITLDFLHCAFSNVFSILMEDDKLWTELVVQVAHQEANIEERPEVVMLQLSED